MRPYTCLHVVDAQMGGSLTHATAIISRAKRKSIIPKVLFSQSFQIRSSALVTNRWEGPCYRRDARPKISKVLYERRESANLSGGLEFTDGRLE